jgi:hypothetical protein
MSAFALLVVYGNLAVIFNTEKLGLPDWPSLPRPFALHDAFLLFGMFSDYSDQSFDFFVLGRRKAEPTRAAEWVELALREHFPLRYPIVYTQLVAPHHWDMLGDGAQRRAWAELATRIRARHNRLHPDQPIDGVRIGVVKFPQSPLGYRGAKLPINTRSELLYADP